MSLTKIEELPLCPFNFIPLSKGKIVKLDRDDYIRFGSDKWHLKNRGYASRLRRYYEAGDTVRLFLHREIMQARPGCTVYHINRNRLDNQQSNLGIKP